VRAVQVLGSLQAKLPHRGATTERVGAVTVRVHRPSGLDGPLPALLWIHGGGYVLGTASQDDPIARTYCEALGAIVVAVDYRLSPQHRFPVPLEDCYDALRWMSDRPSIDPARIAIGGASAGAGLAAGLALLARDRGEVAPVFQLLAYPMLDDRTALRTSMDERSFRLWNNKANAFGWRSYTGREPGSQGLSALAAPARATDLSGLPAAWLGVGTLDLFHDEDVAYAERLREAGVPCQLEVVDGAFHGFDLVAPKAAVTRSFRESQVAALAAALAPSR
jgi:acetyl esterase/lipase